VNVNVKVKGEDGTIHYAIEEVPFHFHLHIHPFIAKRSDTPFHRIKFPCPVDRMCPLLILFHSGYDVFIASYQSQPAFEFLMMYFPLSIQTNEKNIHPLLFIFHFAFCLRAALPERIPGGRAQRENDRVE
jgi:hypothetical protein